MKTMTILQIGSWSTIEAQNLTLQDSFFTLPNFVFYIHPK